MGDIKIGSKVTLTDIGGLYENHPHRILPKGYKNYNISNRMPSLKQSFTVIGYQNALNPGYPAIILTDNKNNAYWFAYYEHYIKYITPFKVKVKQVIKELLKEEILKPGTKIRILFRPLKKLCEKRGWFGMYENLKHKKGKKHDLIFTIDTDNKPSKCFSYFKRYDGKYYDILESYYYIPTSCFKVVKETK